MHKELPALLDKYGFKMYMAEDIKAKRLKKFIDKLNKIKWQCERLCVKCCVSNI